MASRRLNPESLVRNGTIPEELKDDPIVIAVCEDTRLLSEARKAFLVVYVALLKSDEIGG